MTMKVDVNDPDITIATKQIAAVRELQNSPSVDAPLIAPPCSRAHQQPDPPHPLRAGPRADSADARSAEVIEE